MLVAVFMLNTMLAMQSCEVLTFQDYGIRLALHYALFFGYSFTPEDTYYPS